MKKKISQIIIVGIIALSSLAVSAQTSPDAIAIRIMQNPNHYSALRWYQEKHFSGSPQSIVVDGYNGIRDGRTVYVNAANVVNGKLYTNIYLISYNQSAENATVDIFGKMVSHWKFNANITNPDEKAKIVRDTIRLEGLNDVKYLLTQYKAANGHYPELNAGSYIKNVSVSTWPSWQDVLAKELKTKLPEDATNKLGACPANFSPKTCWDEKERMFADSDLNDPRINLPIGSSAFVYQTDGNGLAYDLCSTMESGYIQGLSNGACNVINNYRLTESSDEHAPQFTGIILPTINSGLEFVGYIKAADQDNDDLIWTFDFQPDFAPANQWSSWSGGVAPVVSNSPNENEKKIAAPKTGKRGSYVFTVKISDGKASTTQVFTITVVNYGPVVLATDKEYVASTTNPFSTSFKVYDLITDYPLGHTFQYGVSFLTSSLMEVFEKIAPENKEYLFSFSGVLTPDNTMNVAGVYPFIFNVKDQYDATTTKEFNIKVINNPPVITTPIGCQQITRQNNPYQACQIKTTDVDGNLINKFTLTQSALGVSIDNNGLIQGTPTIVGIQPIEITATDEYGATSQAVSYDLHVNNYCGDGVRQSQNTEGRGGVNDGGQEQCDGSDSIALTPGDSSFTKQYECSGSCPIDSVNCSGCLSVGGWCGDGGTPQFSHGEGCDYGLTNGFVCSAPYGGSCTYCDGICQEQTELGPYCGNGVKDGLEQCDSGSSNGIICTAPYGGSCLYCDASCHSQTVQGLSCGDGVISNGEQCDGANIAGKSCTTLGFTGGTLSCSSLCSFNTAACYSQICGNNSIEGSEVCDGSALAGNTCTSLGFTGGILGCATSCSSFNTASCYNECLSINQSSISADMVYSYNGSTLTFGTIGDNYWVASCGAWDRSISFNVPDVSKIASFKLIQTAFDDWIMIKLNGNIVRVGPYGGDQLNIVTGGVQYTSTLIGACELSTSWNQVHDIEMKQFLQNGVNKIDMRVIVAGGGEGYAKFLVSDLCN